MRMDRARYDAVLPRDLIAETLSWVPVKALSRLRCVCKSWNSLIFDPSFVRLHLQRSSRRDTAVLFSLSNYKFDARKQCSLHYCSMKRLLDNPSSPSTVDDGGFQFNTKYLVIGVCNGLVCLGAMACEGWVRFWNPATRLRSKKSPCIKIGFRDVKMGFGYNDSSDTYKVVAAVLDRKSREVELRVHCLGDNCWRKIASWTGFPPILEDKGRFVSGTLNWIAKCDATDHCVIFSFDIRKETYRYLSLPVDVDVQFGDPGIGAFRGCLCLSHDYKRTHLAFWQMKEFGVQKSWTLLKKISYEYLQISPSPIWLSIHPNSDVMLVANKSELELVLYNWRDNRGKHIGTPSRIVVLESTDYVQSLVLPYRI